MKGEREGCGADLAQHQFSGRCNRIAMKCKAKLSPRQQGAAVQAQHNGGNSEATYLASQSGAAVQAQPTAARCEAKGTDGWHN